jgi:hypothetical protein
MAGAAHNYEVGELNEVQEQFIAPPFTREQLFPKGKPSCDVDHLAVAMVCLAARDYLCGNAEDKKSAVNWIFHGPARAEKDYLTFFHACEILDLNKRRFREQLRDVKSRGEKSIKASFEAFGAAYGGKLAQKPGSGGQRIVENITPVVRSRRHREKYGT